MPVIFASPDIAAIVAAFPPPGPARDQVTLLRCASGERLLNSKKLLGRLDRLLGSSEQRVPVSSLSAELGLRAIDISPLLSSHDSRLHYSNDLSHLLSGSEVERLLDDLRRACHTQFVDLVKWSRDRDVSPDLADDFDMASYTGNDHVRYLYHQSLADQTKATIAEELERIRPEKCNLLRLLPNVPMFILERIAMELAADSTMRLSVESSRAGVTMMPAEWHAFQQRRMGDQAQARVERVVEAVTQTGFAKVDVGDGDDGTLEQLSMNGHALVNVRLTTFRTPQYHVVMRQDLLDEAAHLIRVSVKILIHEQWAAKEVEPSIKLSDSSILATLNRLKLDSATDADSHNPEIAQEFGANHGHGYSPEITVDLCTIVLESSQRKALVDDTTRATIDALVHDEQSGFSTIAQEGILSPLHLYEAGLSYIQDEALRERNAALSLQLILKDHLRPALARVKETHLCHDRRRAKDIQTFTSAITDEVATLDSLSAAVKMLQKKQSIPPPSKKQLQDVQVQVLQKATKALTPNKSRDSDILQHFLWVQFAHNLAYFTHERQPALFVSGGKDTTRMIKALKALAPDSQGVRRGESFCEGLKKGTAGTMEGYVVYGVAQRNVEEIMSLWGYDVSCQGCKMPKTKC
ncbi:hypothetical protein LTR95_012780, partial [Oleoguttula sp. CCFEE 5521]